MKITTRKNFLDRIEEKKIYYITSQKIKSSTPHYYICVKRSKEDLLVLTLCTSQEEKVKRYVVNRDLPYETMVWIKPGEGYPFEVDTFINCNDVHLYSVEEFGELFDEEQITFEGEIVNLHYQQILIGLHASPEISKDIKGMPDDPESID